MSDLSGKYRESVALKYQIYSALFLTLPFPELQDINEEVLTFSEYSRQEIQAGKSPESVVNAFFERTLKRQELEYKIRILLLLLQFLERDVVLLDALENAAFLTTHEPTSFDLGTPAQQQEIAKFLNDYRVRIVLTAHPTQFYPFQVLEIIEDLAVATKNNELTTISNLLLQLGKTSFKNPNRLSPLDEVDVHIYFLEHVFYPVLKHFHEKIRQQFPESPTIIELGFWPGGDRDGNPFVTTDVTIKTLQKLRYSILELYLKDISDLKRRLTFPNMWPTLDRIHARLLVTQQGISIGYQRVDEFLKELNSLRDILIAQHNGLFIEKLDSVITAVRTFGFHFVKMDLRQDSRVHTQALVTLLPSQLNYLMLSPEEKWHALVKLLGTTLVLDETLLSHDPLVADVIGSLRIARDYHLERYIISNTQSALNILELLILMKFAGLSIDAMKIDIVPLFETITDLSQAPEIMEKLYQWPQYQQHLKHRHHKQTVMLGYSDGTKDGGYLKANVAIWETKIALYQQAQANGIQIQFFDGRGGTPARGGGNLHQFYRAMSQLIDQREIQLTIQGQSISTDFASEEVAQYHIEQLFMAGLTPILGGSSNTSDFNLLDRLSDAAYHSYQNLKTDPQFIPYLEQVTPIHFYAELNNASRPPVRHTSDALTLSDLRAIPYVGAWSQVKQHVPVYYGMGTAIKTLIDQGEETALKNLYSDSMFFKTLIDNASQTLLKLNFSLTSYLKEDKIFGVFWNKLQAEAELCIEMVKRITQQTALLTHDRVAKSSIDLRESILIPLLVIQQFALQSLRLNNLTPDQISHFHKLIIKTLAASTNASRYSA